MATAKPASSAGLHFVVSTGSEKPDPELRKFIRSHVMLGKNLGRPRPDRRKKRKPGSSQSTSDTSPKGSSHPDTDVMTIPPKIGSVTSTIEFAEFLEPGTVDIVLKRECSLPSFPSSPLSAAPSTQVITNKRPTSIWGASLLVSSISKQMMFVLEPCILFERRAENWVAPLAYDPVYLHTMIFAAHFYFEAFLPCMPPSSPSTVAAGSTIESAARGMRSSAPHYGRAVRLLRERLEGDANGGDEMRLCDTTLAAVMTLANVALFTGDLRLARHHVQGLAKMFTLKGYASMRRNSKLLLEMLRSDIGLSLHTGSRPVFLDNTLFRGHLIAYPDFGSIFDLPKNMANSIGHAVPMTATTAFPTAMNPELVRVWTVLSDLCAVVERAVATRQYITTDVLLDVMASTMYNLAGLRCEPASTDELLRLGLLAFSCSVFMHWRTLGRSFAHLATEFRSCLQDPAVMSQLSPELSVWLLVIGAVSVFGVTADDDGWLKPLLRDMLGRCEMRSWEDARGFMKSLLWIGLVHDTTGARVFGSVGDV